MAKKNAMVSFAGESDVPLSLITDRWAFLGRSGSGKSYGAMKLAEQFLDHGQVVAAVDPQGVWHGLKNSADGKSAGYPIPVLGGDYGDVPLSRKDGKAAAHLIAKQRQSCVFDLSMFESDAARYEFVCDFCLELRRLNRTPCHVFFDEAHNFCPLNAFDGGHQSRCLNAVNRLFQQGRQKGIGASLITQRPAAVHKSALTQVGAMCVFRTASPQDRKAVKDWIEAQADASKTNEIIKSIGTLGVRKGRRDQSGWCWLWLPSIDLLEKVRVLERVTFDASRTPEVGEEVAVITHKSQIDVAALAKVFGRDDADDDAKGSKPAKNGKPRELTPEERAAIVGEGVDAAIDLVGPAIEAARKSVLEHVERSFADIETRCAESRSVMGVGSVSIGVDTVKPNPNLVTVPREKVVAADLITVGGKVDTFRVKHPSGPRPPVVGPAGVKMPDRITDRHLRIVAAVRDWQRIGIVPDKKQVAFGVSKSAKGGSFNTDVSAIRTSGGFGESAPGTIMLSEEGARWVGGPGPVMGPQQARDWVMQRLEPRLQRMLDVVLSVGGGELEVVDLARRLGKSASGGSFNTDVSALCSKSQAIHRVRAGVVAPAKWLV